MQIWVPLGHLAGQMGFSRPMIQQVRVVERPGENPEGEGLCCRDTWPGVWKVYHAGRILAYIIIRRDPNIPKKDCILLAKAFVTLKYWNMLGNFFLAQPTTEK